MTMAERVGFSEPWLVAGRLARVNPLKSSLFGYSRTHSLVRPDNTIPAIALRLIERFVRGGNDLFGRAAIGRKRRRTDAERHLLLWEFLDLDAGANAFREPLGLVCGRLGQHDAKLVATVARDAVHFTNHASQQASNLFQHVVPGRVAERVVVFLELVDVSHQDAEWAIRA